MSQTNINSTLYIAFFNIFNMHYWEYVKELRFLDPEGGSQKATLAVVLLVGIKFSKNP